jgi:lysophospholipase
LEGLQARYIHGRDGQRLRTATFDAAPDTSRRGDCVLLSGQTEFIEKYVEVIGELRARGFAVATLDWRGQGGSHRELPEKLKVHISDFREYDDDLASFMEQVVRPMTDRPPIALAHSMGGHILMRGLHARPDLFAAAVFSAPMIDFLTRGYPRPLARAACYLHNLFGRADDWVWGMDGRDPLMMSFADQLVTSDTARFQRSQDFIARHPDIRLAGPSWGWLEAAYRSIARVKAPGYAETITTPMLIFGAGKDRIVETNATEDFAKRLPNGCYLDFKDAEHEILMERDEIRARFWDAFDGFVADYI